jgi:hypothetical protein
MKFKTTLGVITVLASMALVQSAQAALVFYGDRTSFDAANPGLAVEDFNDIDDVTVGFTGPLNSTTNTATIDPGDILPGIEFVDNPGPGSMFVAASGQSSNPTTAIGQNSPATDALDILLNPGVTAIGFDIFQNFGGGSQSGVDQLYPVSVYGAGDVLLGSISVTVPSGQAGFFGVASDSDLITRVSVNNRSAFDVIDTVAFGGAGDFEVPVPGTLAVLGAGLLALGGLARRRRS